MAIFKEILKFALKEGKEATIKKYGYGEVKKAQDSMKRAAKRKSSSKNETKADTEEIRTPTKVTKKRKTPEQSKTKEQLRNALMEMMRNRPEDAMTTVVGPNVSSASKKKIMKPSKARKKVEETTGETRSELDSRLSRDATQMGVGSASGNAGPATPKYKLSREQASDAIRGRYDVEPKNNVEADLVDILKEKEFKKGGKVSTPRGCGVAQRGYGKAMRG
jgi:hypothetical protein